MRILVITSCTGQKAIEHPNSLTLQDFLKGDGHIAEREKQLSEQLTPAQDLYTGQQHLRLMRGIRAFRERFGADQEHRLDLWILSAGYGMIPADRRVAPYECTFQGMKKKTLAELSAARNIPAAFREVVGPPYDLGVILLGDSYLKACQLDENVKLGGPTLIFCGSVASKWMPTIKRLKNVVLSNPEARRFKCGLVGLKGELAARLLMQVATKLEKVEILAGSELDLLDALDAESPLKSPPERSMTSVAAPVIKIPRHWWDDVNSRKIRYFIPEWDDLVDPNYDFKSDTHPDGSADGYELGHYAHQIYDSPPYDGILISKVVMDMKKKKWSMFEKLGVHQYLRVPREFPIMGDCGAFGYVDQETPPYQTEDILDYYQRFDFDYGVSIDHLIVDSVIKKECYYLVHGPDKKEAISKQQYERCKADGILEEIRSLKRQLNLFDQGPCLYKTEELDEEKRQYRYDITLKNAKNFIDLHAKKGCRFTPIGAVQGWSPESYSEAVRECQNMGYCYIGLGGLVRTQTQGIMAILESIQRVLKKDVGLHLFGVARPDAIVQMHRLGVVSVDSASFLRRAWLGASSNYFMPDRRYAAVRIPQAESSPRAKAIVRQGKATLEEVKQLEANCLKQVRAYDRGEVDVDTVLEAVMAYDDLMGENRNGHRELIRKTLEDKPWKTCKCEICQEHGVEVIIFRGNNRNRRRGFHNTKVFYDQFRQMFGNR